MHYYQFNIGDYASHTSRISPIEDLAYRRMLDLYYLNEHQLNGCSSDVAREIGLNEYEKEVDYVLSKFFEKNETGFSQKRIDLEIKKYKNNAKNKIKAGKASAKARQTKALTGAIGVEQVLNECSTGDEQNINHKPLTKKQEPITNKQTQALAMLVGMSVDKTIAAEWLKVRKTKRLTSTETAFKAIEREAKKAGLTMNQAVTRSVVESWGGFKAEWLKADQKGTKDFSKTDYSAGTEGFLTS